MDDKDQLKLAMCWFDAEQWTLLKDLDPDGADDTYEEWRRNANKAFNDLRDSGQNIVSIN